MSVMLPVPNGLAASQNPDGTHSWSGSYEGIPVRTAIPLNEGRRWIILLDPDADLRSAFENLLCIDQNGVLVWKAKLPTSSDVFVAVAVDPEGILGATWSGFNLRFDENTGAEVDRVFVK